MYIAEEAFKKAGVKANIQYHTALPGATFPAWFCFELLFSSFVWCEEVCRCTLGGGQGQVISLDGKLEPSSKYFQGHQCQPEAQLD